MMSLPNQEFVYENIDKLDSIFAILTLYTKCGKKKIFFPRRFPLEGRDNYISINLYGHTLREWTYIIWSLNSCVVIKKKEIKR
jgi:hypothetical protein